MKVYLDHNATTPMRPQVQELVFKIMQGVGNASSVHGYGREARKYIEDARTQVADLCHAQSEQVTFTSGATESINAVLNAYKDKRVLTSAVEHPAVLACAPHADLIPVTTDGVIDMDAYEALLNQSPPPALVCLMLVNSETGVIQPVSEAAKLAHDKGALVFVDAVQGAGRLDLNMRKLGADFIAISAHKMAGPQGVGALLTKDGLKAPPFMLGGGQEKNGRAGTHNTAGIAGMGLAAAMAKQNLSHYTALTKLRDDMEARLRSLSNNLTLYGQNAPRVGNTTNVGLKGMPAQTQLMSLDLDGIAVSSGSACSSGAFKPSHVLTAMGANEEEAKSALRISLGWNTTTADIEAFLESYEKIIKRTQS
jgi:cysteine desulfurase